MPEPTAYSFSFKELAEMMIRELDLKEGIWGLQVQFGIAATNGGMEPGDLRPMAIVPIMNLGLQRFDTVTAISADAAEVQKTDWKRAGRPAPEVEIPAQTTRRRTRRSSAKA